MTRSITVAIDGPAGAGKSTVAKAVALRLNYTLVDTGAIYRTVALMAQRADIPWDDESALAELIKKLEIGFRFVDGTNHVIADGEDVSETIRTPDISTGASQVSQLGAVRAGLLTLQRELAGQGGAVLEGRDIGTVVCPDAEVKIFLDAAPEERALRRLKELEARGDQTSFDAVLEDIRDRDTRDRERDLSPLKPAEDATVLDCTAMSPNEVIEAILELNARAVSSS